LYLILFDIDGTLIFTDGAGMRAFRSAIYDVFGIQVEKGIISPDGKTDPLILKEVLQYYRSPDLSSDDSRNKVFAKYLEYLKSEMMQAQESGRVQILPGVISLLDALESQPDFEVGLATGNLKDGARIKLEHAGLDGYFHFGGFGSDSEDRTILTKIGIQRGIEHVSPAFVHGSFVIGDTPFDVEHGRAAGAGVISVASGRYDIGRLHACNPDLVLSDLTPVETILSFLRNNGYKNRK
jgi:phosphoglycolate phosphatase